MALRKIHNTYYVYFKDIDGSQRTRSLKTTDKAVAEKLHKVFMIQLQGKKGEVVIMRNFSDRFPGEQITSVAPKREVLDGEHVRGGISLKKMFDCAAKKRTWKEEKRIKSFWDHFVSQVDVKYADQITSRKALEYLERNFGKSSGKTYNNHKSVLNSIFRLCLVEAGLSQSPFATIADRQVRNVQHHRPLTEMEFKAAFEAAAEPWKTAAIISWFTALRRETCFRLAWEHIDIKDRSITIIPGKTARFGRAVYIPIHPQLWEHLLSLPRPKSDKTPILSQFPQLLRWNDEKRKLTYFVGLLKSLGINDTTDGKASFHGIRASFITRCDEAGVNRRATRGVAGQMNDNITDLYSRDKETAKEILKLKGF